MHDPYVPQYRGELGEPVQNCDAAISMLAHDDYGAVHLGGLRARVASPS